MDINEKEIVLEHNTLFPNGKTYPKGTKLVVVEETELEEDLDIDEPVIETMVVSSDETPEDPEVETSEEPIVEEEAESEENLIEENFIVKVNPKEIFEFDETTILEQGDEVVTFEKGDRIVVLPKIEEKQPTEDTELLEDEAYDYQLLGRLKQDCITSIEKGSVDHLWGVTVEAHIAKMRELYAKVPEKPDWLSVEDIDYYEEELMKL